MDLPRRGDVEGLDEHESERQFQSGAAVVVDHRAESSCVPPLGASDPDPSSP